LALGAGWLAALWLTLACKEQRPGLFAAFQVALMLAVLYGVTDWLKAQPWLHNEGIVGFFDPRSLHVYGIGLAVLGLLFVLARLALRATGLFRNLLNPEGPAMDRAMLLLLVLAQLALAVSALWPELGRELGLADALPQQLRLAEREISFGMSSWLLLASLAYV